MAVWHCLLSMVLAVLGCYMAFLTSSTRLNTFIDPPVASMASLKWVSHQGQVLTMALAPVDWASSTRSLPVDRAKSGNADLLRRQNRSTRNIP